MVEEQTKMINCDCCGGSGSHGNCEAGCSTCDGTGLVCKDCGSSEDDCICDDEDTSTEQKEQEEEVDEEENEEKNEEEDE